MRTCITGGLLVFLVGLCGCGTPSADMRYSDDILDSPDMNDMDERPASLIEVEWGRGEGAEVTKNIPAAAAQKVRKAFDGQGESGAYQEE